jgi:hypothetical protein
MVNGLMASREIKDGESFHLWAISGSDNTWRALRSSVWQREDSLEIASVLGLLAENQPRPGSTVGSVFGIGQLG